MNPEFLDPDGDRLSKARHFQFTLLRFGHREFRSFFQVLTVARSKKASGARSPRRWGWGIPLKKRPDTRRIQIYKRPPCVGKDFFPNFYWHVSNSGLSDKMRDSRLLPELRTEFLFGQRFTLCSPRAIGFENEHPILISVRQRFTTPFTCGIGANL